MRFLAGIALFLTGFVWLAMLAPGSALERLFFGQLLIAYATGGYLFGMGIFNMLPHPWTWGEGEAGWKKALRGIWTLVSAVAVLAGLGFFAAALVFLPSDPIAVSILEVIVGSSLLAGGLDQIRKIVKATPNAADTAALEATQVDAERVILQVARAHAGRVTAAEVAADSALSYRDAAANLKQMVSDGLCVEKVMEEGTSFFYFPEFASAERKRDMMDEGVVFDTFDAEVESGHEEAVRVPNAPYFQK